MIYIELKVDFIRISPAADSRYDKGGDGDQGGGDCKNRPRTWSQRQGSSTELADGLTEHDYRPTEKMEFGSRIWNNVFVTFSVLTVSVIIRLDHLMSISVTC